MDYNAHFCSPYLGKFVSADTLIPDPGNVLAWDRYGYVLNNPIRFSDPSAHYEFEETPSDNQLLPAVPGIMGARRSTTPYAYTSNERRSLINQKGKRLAEQKIASLDAFTSLVEFGATLYSEGDSDNFIQDMTCVINGYCGRPIGIFRLGYNDFVDPTWFLGQDIFKGQGSWDLQYYDFTDNQMYHFWFYVAVSYWDSYPVAWIGNFVHDPGATINLISVGEKPVWSYTISPWVTERASDGKSYQDYLLGVSGAKLGWLLNVGSVTPRKTANWVFKQLSR